MDFAKLLNGYFGFCSATKGVILDFAKLLKSYLWIFGSYYRAICGFLQQLMSKGLFVDFWQLLKGCFLDFVDHSVANVRREGRVHRFWGDRGFFSSDIQGVSQYSSHFISLQCVGPKCSNNES